VRWGGGLNHADEAFAREGACEDVDDFTQRLHDLCLTLIILRSGCLAGDGVMVWFLVFVCLFCCFCCGLGISGEAGEEGGIEW